MPRWEEHYDGTFHFWRMSPRVSLHRATADGTITVFVSTFDHDFQTTTSFPIPDKERAAWVEALALTEPADEGESR